MTIVIFGVTGFIFWLSWSMYLLKLVGVNVIKVLFYTLTYTLAGLVGLILIRGYFF